MRTCQDFHVGIASGLEMGNQLHGIDFRLRNVTFPALLADAPLPLPPPLTLPPSSPPLVPSSSPTTRVDREYPSLQGAIGVGRRQAAPPLSRPHAQDSPAPSPPSAPPQSRLLLSSPLLFIFSVESSQSWSSSSPACTAVPPPELYRSPACSVVPPSESRWEVGTLNGSQSGSAPACTSAPPPEPWSEPSPKEPGPDSEPPSELCRVPAAVEAAAAAAAAAGRAVTLPGWKRSRIPRDAAPLLLDVDVLCRNPNAAAVRSPPL